MSSYSYISNAHPAYIEALYADYCRDSNAIDSHWRKFFEGFEFAIHNPNGHTAAAHTSAPISQQAPDRELKVYQLIQAYRQKGHLESQTNPISKRRDRHAHLQLADFGLSDADLALNFAIGREIGLPNATLQAIIDRLRLIYCGPLGFEFTYISDPQAYNWLKQQIEERNLSYGYPIEKKQHILSKLNETVVFERFLHTKYVNQKRFSLEGGESTIPALDAIINQAGDMGCQEVVIGMAHRGRLNVLVNTLRKTYEDVFNEFEGIMPDDLTMGDGDVKYHLGFSSQITTPSGKEVYLKLVPNPSHLEAVNPVVEGFARAKADVIYQSRYDDILPLLIHGDAAVAGQGIVYEVLQMCKLEGYYTGGTVHFVINNQIGFTTDFDDARSADYCTSVAAMVKAPVIHVNGDDVEAVVFAAELAVQFRQKFNTDVFVDMVCYRRHGHNEADDPQYTQPQMYVRIARHKNPRDIYSEQLAAKGEVEAAMAEDMQKGFWDMLQDRLNLVKQKALPYHAQKNELEWLAMIKPSKEDFEQSPITGISKEHVNIIVEGLSRVPEGFKPLSKVQKMLEKRRETMQKNKSLDWAAAELIGYASILLDGKNVRMSGQDVKRGTFSHRHAVLYDEAGNNTYNRLNHFVDNQGRFLIYNSLLSEYAVLGFEYGYSLASPQHLVVWEAQFGDFSNGAQIIIDQFLTSSESKWQRNSGMMLLLPHGYEGQGPEHSSARLERFLQAAAEQNICVVNITDAANFFHVIRRQLMRPFRKPLIVMSPKSGLRTFESSIFDIIGDTRFREILDDTTLENREKVRKILLCSGKVYYDLAEGRKNKGIDDVAIIRIEQLYPLAQGQLETILGHYPQNAELVWVQEEPENMGAWWYIADRLRCLGHTVSVVARKTSASPATGYYKLHPKEQQAIVENALK